MNPQHNKQIFPVPWHFLKSRFFCNYILNVVGTLKASVGEGPGWV